MSIVSQQQHLLDKVLTIVPFTGWTMATIEQAETEAELPSGAHLALFPQGVGDVLAFWQQHTNAVTEQAYKALQPPPVRIRDKVAAAVLCRLQAVDVHKEAVRAALGYYALPMNALAGMRNTWQTVDTLWYMVGDKSTDFNYYSKRTLLAVVYTSTLLVWLNDDSADHRDTKEFLARRIDDVMHIEKAKQYVKAWTPNLPSFLQR